MNDELKVLMSRAVQGVEPSTDGLHETFKRVGRRRRNKRLTAAVVALVVFCLSFGGLWAAFRGPKQAPEPETSGLPVTATEIFTAPLAREGDLSSMVLGESSLWISDHETASVLRVDPQTGDLQATISLTDVPGWAAGGGGMAFSEGNLWVTGSTLNPDGPGTIGILQRIDATNNQVTSTIPVGGSSAADVTVLDSGVWVLLLGERDASQLVRVDPLTDHVVSRFDVPLASPRRISTFDGMLWLEGGTDGNNALLEVDPATGHVVSATKAAGYIDFAVGSSGLWAIKVNSIVQLDSTTLQPAGQELAASSPISMASVAEGDQGELWVIEYGPGSNGPPNQLTLFDSEGRNSQTVAITTGSAIDFSLSQDSVWVLTYEGTLIGLGLSR